MDTLFANAIKKSSAFCKISAAACALLVGSSAFAEFKMDDIKLTEFRANGIYSSNTTGNTTSGELGWFPSYSIHSDWSVRGFLGLSPFKGTADTYVMSEFGILGGYKINPQLEVELGAGIQAGKSTSASMITSNVLWSLEKPFMGYVEKIFAGYSSVSFDVPSSQIKLGIILTFGSSKNGVASEIK